jgi:ABC-2 type transport system ATP-binding protein
MQPMIQTRGLTKRYGGEAVVDGLDLTVREGCIYGFLGPNGAGKSTTLKMLLGLVRPTGGEIDLFGQRLSEKNRLPLLRQIGSLIESPAYYGHLTGRENLKILQILLDVPEKNMDEVLKIVRLEEQQNKRVSAYSLGMKQRLGLAGALLSFPKLLLLDEPTNGLDPAGIQEMRALICSLPKRYGMTVVVSSHLLSEIDQIAEDMGVLANGQMQYQGTLAGLHALDSGKSLEEIFLTLTGTGVSL